MPLAEAAARTVYRYEWWIFCAAAASLALLLLYPRAMRGRPVRLSGGLEPPTSTRARGGLGLGLSIVRHLVERHGEP